jgi:hypothetical protein
MSFYGGPDLTEGLSAWRNSQGWRTAIDLSSLSYVAVEDVVEDISKKIADSF